MAVPAQGAESIRHGVAALQQSIQAMRLLFQELNSFNFYPQHHPHLTLQVWKLVFSEQHEEGKTRRERQMIKEKRWCASRIVLVVVWRPRMWGQLQRRQAWVEKDTATVQMLVLVVQHWHKCLVLLCKLSSWGELKPIKSHSCQSLAVLLFTLKQKLHESQIQASSKLQHYYYSLSLWFTLQVILNT